MKKKKQIDGSFIPHRRAMLESPAWRALGCPGTFMLARIELEHLRHGGQDNGCLVVTYANFVEYSGMHRRMVVRGIQNAEALGFIRITRGRAGEGNSKIPSRYTLTYLPVDGKPPTDDWRKMKTIDDARTTVATSNKSRKPSQWLRSLMLDRGVPH